MLLVASRQGSQATLTSNGALVQQTRKLTLLRIEPGLDKV
jgi:hypothetical protein